MKSALLVIDVQSGIFASGLNLFEADEVVQKINSLGAEARSRSDLVIFIQHEAPGVVEHGSERWQLYSKLVVESSDLKVRKATPDSFLGSDLEKVLQAADVKQLVIKGYASDFCIDRTTFSAACRGYSVKLVRDGHTTQSKGQLSAQQIRDHHNQILAMHPAVTLVAAHCAGWPPGAAAEKPQV